MDTCPTCHQPLLDGQTRASGPKHLIVFIARDWHVYHSAPGIAMFTSSVATSGTDNVEAPIYRSR